MDKTYLAGDKWQAGSPLFLVSRVSIRYLICFLLAFVIMPAGAAPRVVRVGVYDNPPKILLSRSHRISGIFGTLLQHIARGEGWVIEPVSCRWKQCLQMLERGKLDLMPDVAFSTHRAKVMDFGTVPALYSWSEVYRNPKAHLMSIRDMQGKRIAVLNGSIQEAYLKHLIKSFGLHGVTIVPTRTLTEGFSLTESGRVDAVIANNYFGDTRLSQYHLDKTPIIFQPVRLFFVTAKGRNADLLRAVDSRLARWKADQGSVYYQVLGQWNSEPVRRPIPASVWWGVGALLLMAAIGAMAQRRLVMDRTRRLQITEEKLAVVLDNVDAYIYIKDLNLQYQYVNKKVADLFGTDREQVTGCSDDILFDQKTVARMQADDRRVIDQGHSITVEEDVVSKDGKIKRSYLTVKQPLHDARGHIYALCGISTDFTEQKMAQEEINRLAFFDSLTGLPNRALLLERADHALDKYGRTKSNGALLFIDLDHFKILNDTLGHTHGDALLQQVAQRLASRTRSDDTLARLGGDEFVLLMEDLGADLDQSARDVESVAHKLLAAFSESYCTGDRVHNITASIGIAMFSDADGQVDVLLKRADIAMYQAKAGGRNLTKFYNSDMQASLDRQAAVGRDLHDALHNEQFVLHYQPQADDAGRLIGAEAVIRWNHPQKGVIGPGDFIPVAELTGQILPLGRWILKAACRQIAAWRETPGLSDLVVAVNVSARQFHHADFVGDVLGALAESDVEPQRLELELTESVLADDLESLIEKMQALKEQGVRFALDDFGTGYSSLSYLKCLPLDRLKIDQSFVRDLLTDANDLAIVKTILALGSSLDLTVIAEGVETPEQRDRLIELGCTRQQGYLVGRPAPADALTAVYSGTRRAESI